MSFQQRTYSVGEDAGSQPSLVAIIKEGGMMSEIELSINVGLVGFSSATNGRYAMKHLKWNELLICAM